MFGTRLSTDHWPAAIYAIGDIHGCHDQLVALEHAIQRDGAAIAGEKWIVTLGDHIDRGPGSAAVIAHLLAPPPDGFTRLALRGNHEQLLLDFLADPGNVPWLEQGGLATLRSYGIDVKPRLRDTPQAIAQLMRERLPPGHLEFLAGLPLLLSLPGWVFVHAGIRPGLPLERQIGEDLIWIREPFLSAAGEPGTTVVHGHTPGREPVVQPGRIGIDTQCFVTGRLTALRVTPGGGTRLFSAGGG